MIIADLKASPIWHWQLCFSSQNLCNSFSFSYVYLCVIMKCIASSVSMAFEDWHPQVCKLKAFLLTPVGGEALFSVVPAPVPWHCCPIAVDGPKPIFGQLRGWQVRRGNLCSVNGVVAPAYKTPCRVSYKRPKSL